MCNVVVVVVVLVVEVVVVAAVVAAELLTVPGFVPLPLAHQYTAAGFYVPVFLCMRLCASWI